jgi:hypothetical protein
MSEREERYARPSASAEVAEALGENIRSVFKTIRPIWGWFVVSVFIVGVPRVIEISANGVKAGMASAKCAFVGCSIGGTQQTYTDDEILDMAMKIAEANKPGYVADICMTKKK